MTTPYDPHNSNGPNIDPIGANIDAYLDGLLAGDELQRFEERMRTEDDLRREVELARRIDASLRSRFEPKAVPFTLNGSPGPAPALGAASALGPAPAPAQALDQGAPRGAAPGLPGDTSARKAVNWRRIGVITGLAAALLLASALVLRFSGGTPPPTGTILERLYARYKADGWEPAWVCEDDAEFAAAVDERLGQPLLIDDEPSGEEDEPDLTVLGWAYGEDVSTYEVIISGRTMVLLTKVDGRGVVALVDRLDEEEHRLRVPEGELSLHRREVGELVIYELTPLDRAHLLDRFFVPRL